jgi:hypothetical protein
MENEERLAGWGLGESGSKPALFLGTKKGAAPNCRRAFEKKLWAARSSWRSRRKSGAEALQSTDAIGVWRIRIWLV